jgi:hypothetical protein
LRDVVIASGSCVFRRASVWAREIAEVDADGFVLPRATAAGPVAEVELSGAFFDLEFAVDGAVGVEDLVGDVGHDGGAAGSDAAFGDENEEAGKELVDGESGVKFGGFGEKVGGEVFEVAGCGDEGKTSGDFHFVVAGTQARFGG